MEKQMDRNVENRNMLPSKSIVVITVLSLLYLGLTFVWDSKIFSSDGLNMNCLPVDTQMIPLMHVLTKLCVFASCFLVLLFLNYCLTKKSTLLVFILYMVVYGVGLLLVYPGYYMNDDPIIFAYATRFLPVYWHNYLTSLFYMTGMSLFPASCGPVLLSDVFYAMIYAFFYDRACAVLKAEGILFRILLILPGLTPFTLLGALMCFRPAIYSSFFLLFFLILYFDYRAEAPLTVGKVVLLSLLCAVLAFWRSESIVLLPIAPILVFFAYKKDRKVRWVGLFFLLTILFYSLIALPQKHGEKAYYGKDYLIISTTRPLSVIVWRDQDYEGADEDLANISAVTEFGYLHNDSLSCSAYTRYNSDHNEGRYTQTGADEKTQSRYIKSALNLILHNFDLYLGERAQLFCVTNGIFNYDKDWVLNLKPVVSTDFHLYEHDRDYGFEMLDAYRRLPIEHKDGYALFLYKFGGDILIPFLIAALILLIGCLVKKKWFLFFVFAALLGREGVIFLTAPASFVQYSYPTMYTVFALLMCFIVHPKRTNTEGF